MKPYDNFLNIIVDFWKSHANDRFSHFESLNFPALNVFWMIAVFDRAGLWWSVYGRQHTRSTATV